MECHDNFTAVTRMDNMCLKYVVPNVLKDLSSCISSDKMYTQPVFSSLEPKAHR